jgi:sugar lactone lactonase YvrE
MRKSRSLCTVERVSFVLALAPLALACSGGNGTSGPVAGNGGAAPDAGAGADASSPHADAGGVGGDGSVAGDGGGPSVPAVVHYVAGVTVSTLAGSDAHGTQDGTGAAAQFDNPTGIALDPSGNLLVTDYDSGRVRRVTAGGVVTTLATQTGFSDAFAAVVASDGSYYVETDANSAGTKAEMTGTIWRLTPPTGSGLGALAVVATGFGRPRSLAPSGGGNLFVVDRTRGVAELVTVATGQVAVVAGTDGTTGDQDGTGASARFNSTIGAAAMPDGSFVVSDSGNNQIRRVTTSGVVTTLTGTGIPSLVDAPCASAGFNAPWGVAVDAAGDIYVSDRGNHVIRRISAACVVETIAGDAAAGYADGAGSSAQFYGQEGIAVSADGKTLYVADGNGGDGSAFHRIRAVAVP